MLKENKIILIDSLDAYGDASNVKTSSDPVAGYIQSYTVIDWSASYQIKNCS